MEPWEVTRSAFVEAGRWYVESVALVGDRWSEPGLGEWDVRALVGHTSRSFVTVESYLGQPATQVEVESAADYYRAIRGRTTGPEVAQRGRDAGAALGTDPAAAVAALAERVLALVGSCDGDELLTSLAGGMRLADYLPTRTLELVVHTLDLAAALGLPLDPPDRPAEQVLALVSELAVGDGRAGELLLAATGRIALPTGFSVL